MKKSQSIEVSTFLSNEVIERKIYLIHGKKVMFDKDLAALYEVQTRNLNKAVARNIERFPEDFMFQLSPQEFKNLMFQFGTSSWGGVRKRPRVFSEHGILMLSSVLNSKRAIQVNIQIMRTFTKIREYILSHRDLQRKIKALEEKYDAQFRVVFETIREIEEPLKQKKNRTIGFHMRRES
jgi:hypothetical protein